MPSRMLHETICASLKLAAVSCEAETLYYRLFPNADDYGRFYATTSIVQNTCFQAGKVKMPNIEKALQELHAAGLIMLYVVDGERYLHIEKWESNQRKRAEKSKFPEPPTVADDCGQLQTSADNCGQPLTNAPVIVNVNVNENVNVTDAGKPAASERKPYGEFGNLKMTEEQMSVLRGKYPAVIDRCLDESDGWIQSKGLQHKYKDWYAFLRNWCDREAQKQPCSTSTPKFRIMGKEADE